MKISRHLSASCGAVALLSIALLFSTCYSSPLLSSLDSEIVKRQSTPCVQQPRALCSHTRGRPEFYHHCIEAMFPCGEEGFTLSYAAKKFDKLQKELDHIGQKLTVYLHLSELCFQTQLEKIALEISRSRVVSPESCLLFETEAINALNKCYKEKSRVCNLLSNTEQEDTHTIHEHLHSVVEAFQVGGAYFNNTVVDMGIPEAVRECSGQSELADSLMSSKLPVKVTWCALSVLYHPSLSPLTNAQLIEWLSKGLNRSTDQFVFSGPDDEGWCSPFDADYSIITWFASPDDPKLSETIGNEGVLSQRPNPALYIQFHEAREKEREISQCGDGIRQAGEFCDYGDNLEGCDLTCNVRYGYKCSTSRLTASECTSQELQKIERPVLCETSSRRSQSMSSRSRIQTISVSSGEGPVDSDLSFDAQLAGSSRAISARAVSLPLLVLIAVFCLWIPRW